MKLIARKFDFPFISAPMIVTGYGYKTDLFPNVFLPNITHPSI